MAASKTTIRYLAAAALVTVAAALATLALPVRMWRTGEMPQPPLAFRPVDAVPPFPPRVWIDTDAACGHERRTDPDDCLALLLLARATEVTLVGLSTTFGNAPLEVTDATTRTLAARLRADGYELPAVHRGSRVPLDEHADEPPVPAHEALRAALHEGPLTLAALGPLTNVAAALAGRPELASNLSLVAVMGRRPGHLFHPSEGRGGGILFGHGPVFRDFNVAMDHRAAALAVALDLSLTLVPYEAAREMQVTADDLALLSARGGASAWVAERARGWLDYWQEEVGTRGFYPFDLLAAARVLDPEAFRCAEVRTWVGRDETVFIPFWKPTALLVTQEPGAADAAVTGDALYCSELDTKARGRLISRLISPPAGER